MTSGVQAVIFDWGGTLTPWHTIDPLEGWLAAVGDEDLAKRLQDAEREVWLYSVEQHRSATLDEVFRRAGIAATESMLTAFHDWWEPHTYTDPDVEPLFTGLHERGIRIGVLSNTIWPRSQHERIFERDEVLALIHGSVYTSEIPWTKPHPEAFRAAMRAVGVTEPGSTVFVGDRLFDDIHGAKEAGMRTVFVPHSDIPPDQLAAVEGTVDIAAIEPDAVISRLLDLLPIIDRWRETAAAPQNAVAPDGTVN
jgi:putative hydrolase of the HAD superfamily